VIAQVLAQKPRPSGVLPYLDRLLLQSDAATIGVAHAIAATIDGGTSMDADEQAIRKLIEVWMTASRAGDTATVLTLMADDAVFLVPGKPPMRGKSAFAAGQDALKDFTIDGHSEVKEVRVMGDWAYAWTALRVAMTPRKGGSTLKRAGNTLSIFKKSAGEWVLFRDANMLAIVPE
jgi:uncharacterized protein (TIGR02246 family)